MRYVRLAAALGGVGLLVGCAVGQDAVPVTDSIELGPGVSETVEPSSTKQQVAESLEGMSEGERAALVAEFSMAYDLDPEVEHMLVEASADPERFHEVLSVDLEQQRGAVDSLQSKCLTVGWYCIAGGLKLYVGPSYWAGSWLCYAAGGSLLVPACI